MEHPDADKAKLYYFEGPALLRAYHGVGAQETLVGNEFIVNLRLRTELKRAIQTDEVGDTLSYAEVFESVKDEMSRPSRLLEHIAGRIVQRLFHDFPALDGIELSLMKRNPPMGADIEGAGVELSVERDKD